MKTVLFVGILLGVAACAAREMAAQATYGNELYARCLANEPVLGPATPREVRLAAYARLDDCMRRVHEHWGVTETTAKDGGP